MWAKTFHKLCFDLFENRQKTERIETSTKEAQFEHIVLSPCRFCSGKPNLVFPSMFTVSAEVHSGDQFAVRNRLKGMFLDHYFFSPEPAYFSRIIFWSPLDYKSLCPFDLTSVIS